jgi:hypothetical protein
MPIIYPDLRLDYKVATHPFQAIWSNRLIVAALSRFGSKRTLLNDFELLVSHQPNDPLFATRDPFAQKTLLNATPTVSTTPCRKE